MNDRKHPHLTRQLDIIPLDTLDQQISIVGAGAIGSFAALALVKMGFENIQVFDDDSVEVENMNCQFFRHKDIGKKKVVALRELIEDFTGVEIDIFPERYQGEAPLPGIVISAVDSMAVRKMIWEAHKLKAVATPLLIDPRMSAETALCYAMRPMIQKDITAYEKTLYSDEKALFERCTAKSTMYTVLQLSGHVAKIVKDIACGQPYSRIMQWSLKAYDQECYKAEVG